jgi:hypothetical protein
VDVRLRALELVGDPRQRALAVDEHLDRVPTARWRRSRRVPARRGVQAGELAEPVQPSPVVPNDDALDPLADAVVGVRKRALAVRA